MPVLSHSSANGAAVETVVRIGDEAGERACQHVGDEREILRCVQPADGMKNGVLGIVGAFARFEVAKLVRTSRAMCCWA